MIQAEHKEWVDKMFPDQHPRLPATVMLEEAGELLQALSKRQQSQQYGLDTRYKDIDWEAEILDAVGDCGIAACSLCNANGWSFDELLSRPAARVALSDPLFVAVDVITAAAELVVDPYSEGLASRYVELLRAAALCAVVDLEQAIATTWDQVKRRTK